MERMNRRTDPMTVCLATFRGGIRFVTMRDSTTSCDGLRFPDWCEPYPTHVAGICRAAF